MKLLFGCFQGWCQVPTPSAAHQIFCPIASVPSDLCWSRCCLFPRPLSTSTLLEPPLALTEVHFLLLPRLPQSYPSAWATESPSSACPCSQDFLSRASPGATTSQLNTMGGEPGCCLHPVRDDHMEMHKSQTKLMVSLNCWSLLRSFYLRYRQVRGLWGKTWLLSRNAGWRRECNTYEDRNSDFDPKVHYLFCPDRRPDGTEVIWSIWVFLM